MPSKLKTLNFIGAAALLCSALFVNAAPTKAAKHPKASPPPMIEKPTAAPVKSDGAIFIKHVWKKGELTRHHILLTIKGDYQMPGGATFYPRTLSTDEVIAMQPTAVTPDGSADVLYTVEKNTISSSEFFGTPAETMPLKRPQKVSMVISPLNMIIVVKRERKTSDEALTPKINVVTPQSVMKDVKTVLQAQLISQYMNSLVAFRRLLEFGPQLPPNSVKIGDTWQEEINYVPGEVVADGKSSSGLNRVILTYTYDSIGKKDGHDVNIIKAKYSTPIDVMPSLKDVRLPTGYEIKRYDGDAKGDLTYYLDKKSGILVLLEGTASAIGNVSILLPDPAADTGKYERREDIKLSSVASSTLITHKIVPVKAIKK